MNHPTQCPICNGTLISGTITHEERDDAGRFFVFEHVPALVCDGCGEYILSDEVVEKLEKITEIGTPVRKIDTPVYDFARVKL